MAAQRVEQIADARPPNEGHDHVDAVSGLDLRLDLPVDVWLAWTIGHENRVTQSGDRSSRPQWLAGRVKWTHGDEAVDRMIQLSIAINSVWDDCEGRLLDRAGEISRYVGTFRRWHAAERIGNPA